MAHEHNPESATYAYFADDTPSRLINRLYSPYQSSFLRDNMYDSKLGRDNKIAYAKIFSTLDPKAIVTEIFQYNNTVDETSKVEEPFIKCLLDRNMLVSLDLMISNPNFDITFGLEDPVKQGKTRSILTILVEKYKELSAKEPGSEKEGKLKTTALDYLYESVRALATRHKAGPEKIELRPSERKLIKSLRDLETLHTETPGKKKPGKELAPAAYVRHPEKKSLYHLLKETVLVKQKSKEEPATSRKRPSETELSTAATPATGRRNTRTKLDLGAGAAAAAAEPEIEMEDEELPSSSLTTAAASRGAAKEKSLGGRK